MIKEKLIWKINRFRIRHTSERILNKFRNGEYLDYTDFCEGIARKKGYISWKRIKRLIDRCLNCGYYIKSHQDLNIDPLAITFFDVYYLLKFQDSVPDEDYYEITDPLKFERRSEIRRNLLKEKVKGKESFILMEPYEGFILNDMEEPDEKQKSNRIVAIAHITQSHIYALSVNDDKIYCHSVEHGRLPLEEFIFPYPNRAVIN